MKSRFASSLTAIAASVMFFTFSGNPAKAATLTWDLTSGDGASITAGSGNWNTTAGNTVWNDAGANVVWSQTSATVATNDAVFAGSDGTENQYGVTLSGTVNALSVTFNNSGYQLTGAALILRPTSGTNGSITVAAGKTATIDSAITYSSNVQANITVNSGSTLNLGGGASNSQYRFAGAGTVNMTAGTYSANIGSMNAATFNQSGGTFNSTPGNNLGYDIGHNAGRSVSYTLSGGTFNANANADGHTVSYLAIGRAAANTAYTNTLNVQGTGTLNVGTTANRSGELHIANTADSNGTLNVTGGTVTVGTGKTTNQIYFFKAGSNAGYTASMTQSAGTVTTNGIQFGGASGTYDGTSAANLTLSGGSLYIGAAGITRGSAATDLPTTIQLQGGTLGADQNWSSALNMQLGTAGGGVTISAANAASTGRTITLSGILSGSGGLVKTGAGTLTLGGANTFEGGITIRNGTVNAITNNAALGTGSVTMGGIGSTGASLITGRSLANNIIVNAPDSGAVVIGANGAGSGYTLSGGITLNGDLAIRTFDNVINGTIKAQGTLTGGITGTGNVVLDNLGLAANTLTFDTGAINHAGSLTLQGTATGDTTISASIGANVTSVTQNSATSRLVLSGNSSYTGATSVTAGTLIVNGNISTSSLTTVSSGATLGGSGTVGALTVLAGGSLAPGNSPGTLNTGTVSLADTSVLAFELNPADFTVGGNINDLISVTGNLTLDGILNVVATSGDFLSATIGTTWRLFDYSGSLTDNVLALGSMPSLGGGLVWDVDTATAGQVNLVIIPEPGAALLGGFGLIVLLRRRRH